jgi:BirA family biotin operon repressor/biotin-[acetyl-CoA-carboxylase] ligase
MAKERVIVNKRPQDGTFSVEHMSSSGSGADISKRLHVGGSFSRDISEGVSGDFPKDVLSVEAITAMLATSYLGRQVIYKETTGSTNDDLRRLIEPVELEDASGSPFEYPPGTVILAETQTGGKGRLGRRWESPPGGVFMSVLLRPDIPTGWAPHLAIVTSYAVASAIRSVTGLDARIKWPNDVLAKGKKICGILCESAIVPAAPSTCTYIICGIGINANQQETDFPEEIRETASSIRILTKNPVDRNALVATVLNNMEPALRQFEKTGLAGMRESLDGLLAFLGRKVVLRNLSSSDDAKVHGIFQGVDDAGRALIEVPGEGVIPFSAGDLSLRPTP